MSRCPNCSYLLVLIERRSKYKCAKCSRLWLQKLIDDRDFKEFNKKQRNLDKKEAEKERAKEWQKNNKDKIRKYYYNNKEKYSEARKIYYRKNKEKFAKKRLTELIRIKKREHYLLNKQKINETNNKYYSLNKNEILERKKQKRQVDINKTHSGDMIHYWKKRQLEIYENLFKMQ